MVLDFMQIVDLFFSHPQIVLQEVPDEISLAISISGCKNQCKDCHSSFTWQDNYGEVLSNEKLISLLSKNENITCVLFYGGEWNEKRLLELFDIVLIKNLKICLYTGLEFDKISDRIKDKIHYLKVGSYIKERGGLSSSDTNQRMYNMKEKKDITEMFWKKI